MSLRRTFAGAVITTHIFFFAAYQSAFAAHVDAGSGRLMQVADQLDAAAAIAHRRHVAIHIPPLRVAPSAAKPAASASFIDRWLQSALASIGREKSASVQARELGELAASLRHLASPSGMRTAELDPTTIAQKVLSARAYQVGGAGPAPAPHETLWEKLLAFMAELLGRILSGIFRATASTPMLGQIFAVVMVLLLVAALSYLVFRLFDALSKRRRRSADADDGSPLPRTLDPDELYQRGLLAANAGRYAQAVVMLFQASLANFECQGTLAFDPSRTPGEYRRAVKRKAAAASFDFDTIAHAFIMAAFAEVPLSKQDWSAVDAAYLKLRAVAAS